MEWTQEKAIEALERLKTPTGATEHDTLMDYCIESIKYRDENYISTQKWIHDLNEATTKWYFHHEVKKGENE